MVMLAISSQNIINNISSVPALQELCCSCGMGMCMMYILHSCPAQAATYFQAPLCML